MYTAQITAPYQVVESKLDATRPFLVVATFRTFNTGMGRYSTRAQANRRARELNTAAVKAYGPDAKVVMSCRILEKNARTQF